MPGTWIPLYASLLNHSKLLEFADATGLDDDAAIGKLVRLWLYAMDHRGCLAKVSDAALARALNVPRPDVDRYRQALVGAGLLEANGMLHDWDQFGGKYQAQLDREAERQRNRRKASTDEPADEAEGVEAPAVVTDASGEPWTLDGWDGSDGWPTAWQPPRDPDNPRSDEHPAPQPYGPRLCPLDPEGCPPIPARWHFQPPASGLEDYLNWLIVDQWGQPVNDSDSAMMLRFNFWHPLLPEVPKPLPRVPPPPPSSLVHRSPRRRAS